MRTYPITEPWCSRAMKKGLTHAIEGEFVFYVNPEIEEDMKPVNPSKRDLLPGGITRQEYDMRLNRLDMEYAIASNELETRNAAIRHYYNNRIDVPSFAISTCIHLMWVAPPKEERNIPVASGVDRGTPVSLTYFKPSVFVCYSGLLVKYSLTWKDSSDISLMDPEHDISIPQVDPLRVEQDYPLKPIRHTKIPNRYPWLQDMKALDDCVISLFTGSPSPLQAFTLQRELIASILTEDQIVGAYNFNMFWNPIKGEGRIYICYFWDNSIKVFDGKGKFIETVCETGHGLCQIFRPTCIFIERTGYITVGDMKVDKSLQRL